MRDFYSVLGVKRDAGADEIKSAWRMRAKSVHPDQNRDDPDANRRFTEVGRAYEVLKDPTKRSRYDQQRDKVEALEREQTIMQQRQSAREAAEKAKIAKANAERILAELARAEAEKAKLDKQAQAQAQAQAAQAKPEKAQAQTGGAQAQPQPQAQAQPQGQTQNQAQGQAKPDGAGESPEAVVSRIFGDTPEAAAAAETLKRETEAEAERAENAEPSGAPRPVSILAPIELLSSFVRRIRGIQPPPEKAPDLVVEATVTIDDLLAQKPVPITLSDGRELRVPLDNGVTQGHVVRLKGQGLKLQGMSRGDVAVTVRVAKNEKFTVDGYDLKTVLPITLEDAVLGCEASVEAPNGPLTVTIPAWSSSDQVIRLDNLGLHNEEGGRGALAVELRVMLWEKPDDKVTDLMRVMREGLFL